MLYAVLATLTTAIIAFPIAIFIRLRYAFVRPGVYVVRQLLSRILVWRLTTVLLSHREALRDGVTVLCILVGDVFN